MKKLSYWAMKFVGAVALLITISGVNSTCFFNFYQPKPPQDALKFRK